METPANVMTPIRFAEIAQEKLEGSCEVNAQVSPIKPEVILIGFVLCFRHDFVKLKVVPIAHSRLGKWLPERQVLPAMV